MFKLVTDTCTYWFHEDISDNTSFVTGPLPPTVYSGRAIAQAVSRWLPTVAARVRDRIMSCGICGGQSGTGAGFLRVLWSPLPIRIPPIAPQSSSSIIRGWYNRLISGQRSKWTQSHPMRLCPVALVLLLWIENCWIDQDGSIGYLNSGGDQFESRSEQWLSWNFSGFPQSLQIFESRTLSSFSVYNSTEKSIAFLNSS
jgi:hypothetical protein